MPVRPSILDRLAFFRLNRTPAPLLDLFGAVGIRTASLAFEMDVFEALVDGHDTPEAVAAAVDADPEGVGHLLDMLAALGYVRDCDGSYRLTEVSRRWLTGDEENLGPWLTFWADLGFRYWAETLEETVRTGERPVTISEWLDDPREFERAQRGFRALGSLLVDDVLDAVTVRESDRDLLAVGGGHALYVIAACRRYPHLDATIVDDPESLVLAREEIAAAEFDDRIVCEGLDVRSDYLGESYDLAFLFGLAHDFDPAISRPLLGRIHDALAPGGRVVVLDRFDDEGPTPASDAAIAFQRFVSFSMLGTETHSLEDVTGWLRATGFEHVERTTFRTLPGIALLEAEKLKKSTQ